MEWERRRTVRHCIAPACKNNSIKYPDKIFFHVPCDIQMRKEWCEIFRRPLISNKAVSFCCEDHFNLEEDMENYMQHKLMKNCWNYKLKKGVRPRPFVPMPMTSTSIQEQPEDLKMDTTCEQIFIEKHSIIYLGLPKKCYNLIKILADKIPLPVNSTLLILRKIRLNDSFDTLGTHFAMSTSDVCEIFLNGVRKVAENMKDLIVWPTRKKLSASFKIRNVDVISIIDCLEINIEQPSNSLHQSLTWSKSKARNTLKYLISCSPNGTVNFISEGYGGTTSDMSIVQDCNYLKKLLNGEVVLADKGFKNLQQELKNIKLIRPHFVSSKIFGILRIHMERVTRRLMEFKILSHDSFIVNQLIDKIDDIVIIACGIVNMQEM